MGDIDTSASYQQLRSTSVHGWSPETNFTRISRRRPPRWEAASA
ncbi:hypothetical protein L915_14555 [Phytophthora nicotianae]|uniref:Uncharacterized protein n=1 Tax=Phytophthora nicotianae TaxID=4792 RepID=W2G9K1_PHYNI|nr:hypothetical protein L915_14555 [Phytophthora nicotianae]ETL33023.1 hypothetical protein L916_14460 [Phytophthora nicotianae]